MAGRNPAGRSGAQTRAPAHRAKAESAPLYAALDLGTNSCRMLIARPQAAQFKVVDSFSRTVQLGSGLGARGRLTGQAISRTVAAIRVCANKLRDHRVERMRLVATQACRQAENADELLDGVTRATGLRLEVIPPDEEARLAVISCAPLVRETSREVLIVDIGGGSTELVWLDLAAVPPGERARAVMRVRAGLRCARDAGDARVVDWISVPLGVATLREKFRDVEDDAAQFALMSCAFEEALDGFAPYDNGHAPDAGGFQIIGTSGTVTTIAATHLGLRRYDRARVDGTVMGAADVDRVVRQYIGLGAAGRRNDPRIGRDRHVLILSGSAILHTVLRLWPTDTISVADRGLREGILYAQMAADGVLETEAGHGTGR